MCIGFFFRETSVDDVGTVVQVSPIVSLSKVYVMHYTYAHRGAGAMDQFTPTSSHLDISVIERPSSP